MKHIKRYRLAVAYSIHLLSTTAKFLRPSKSYRCLSKKRIKPGIKTRSNSKVKSTTNCHSRNMSVKSTDKAEEGWKRNVSDTSR